MKPISVQLYSLREASKADFGAVLERLSAIGYAGVEPFHPFGMTARQLRERIAGLGMQISSSHWPWANRAPLNEVVDTVKELGLTRAAGGFGPDDFKDRDAIQRTAATTNSLVEALGAHGIELFLHNHWWEYELLDGAPTYRLLQQLCPGVKFEIDTYWASNFGAVDVPDEITRVRDRTPLLHIKDGSLVKDQPNVAVGAGSMDVAGVIAAADINVLEWLIVELDACATDMMTAVEGSFRYLTAAGLGRGNTFAS